MKYYKVLIKICTVLLFFAILSIQIDQSYAVSDERLKYTGITSKGLISFASITYPSYVVSKEDEQVQLNISNSLNSETKIQFIIDSPVTGGYGSPVYFDEADGIALIKEVTLLPLEVERPLIIKISKNELGDASKIVLRVVKIEGRNELKTKENLIIPIYDKDTIDKNCKGKNTAVFSGAYSNGEGEVIISEVSGCKTDAESESIIEIKTTGGDPIATIDPSGIKLASGVTAASQTFDPSTGIFSIKGINLGVHKDDFVINAVNAGIDFVLDELKISIKNLTGNTPSTPSFAGCDGIMDAEEKESCENCVWAKRDDPATVDFFEGEPTGAVWTEIGCVDPSPAGLITRAFQIGVGIMGGVAVIRIIQIAIILQGDDAQKKQEAPGMIWGLAGGLLFLAVGLLVLRYLGINVIGLPDTFLGR